MKKYILYGILVLGFAAVSLFFLNRAGFVSRNNLGLESAVALGLKPARGQVKAGDSLPLEVWVDTNGEPVDGVDAVLTFDPALLEAVGVAFEGSVFTNYPGKDFILNQSSKGMIRFSALPDFGKTFQGKGRVAVVTFRAKVRGEAKVLFSFEKNKTVDSNVALGGVDSLGRVYNGTYKVR